MIETELAPYFKPEVRKQGSELVEKNVISLSSTSDTRVEAFVRVSSAARVTLSSTSISATSLTALCNCSAYAKGQFCKHIWAVLLKVETTGVDFLENKREIERVEIETKAAQSAKLPLRTPPPISEERQRMMDERKETARVRANEYRKAQYQKLKEQKRGATKSEKRPVLQQRDVPDDIREALAYFDTNGFPMTQPIDVEALKNAKRLLSRIFHPDKGGSHDEILALNENFDKLFELSREP